MMRHMLIVMAVVLAAPFSPLSVAAATVTQQWDLDEYEAKSPVIKSASFDRNIKRLSSLTGFNCHFDQLIAFTDGGGKHYSGNVAVLKPKRFRWQYLKPYEQLYLGDGDVIWHYEPDLMQAERLSNIEAVDSSVMGLLDGSLSAAEIELFKHEYDSELDIQRYQVRLKGSPEVWLGFSKNGNLVYIERQDALGNRNQMRLSECSYIAPSKNLFSFTPPEGVDVLDMRQAE